MEERPVPTTDPAPFVPPAPPSAPRHAVRPRAVLGALGVLALAFALGALAYREAAAGLARPTSRMAGAVVAGHQAPPSWVEDFARAFCHGDAQFVGAHVAGDLDVGVEQIAAAFAKRNWNCSSSRYLGTAENTEGQHHVFVLAGKDQQEQWFVFTVMNEKVVAID